MDHDVAIIGGGAGGLALAYECGKLGAACVILEHSWTPSYASTRNQGWLHSGALYAYYGAMDLAVECREALIEVETLANFHGQSLVSKQSGIALLPNEEQAQTLVQQAAKCRIDTRILKYSELSEVGRDVLSGPYHNYAVEIPDKVIDRIGYLNFLSCLAQESGTEFVVSPDLLVKLRVKQERNHWSIDTTLKTLRAKALIVAAGAKTPEVLRRLIGVRLDCRVKTCYVIASLNRNADRIYTSPNIETGYLNIVPFSSGVTINCGNYDCIESRDPALAQAILNTTKESIETNWPAAGNNGFDYSHYTCQKLELWHSAPGRRRGSYIEEVDSNLFYYYPSKLTTALRGARLFAGLLNKRPLGFQHIERPQSEKRLSFGYPGELGLQAPAAGEFAHGLPSSRSR